MTSQTSKTESETVSTEGHIERSDFEVGDRVWVKTEGALGAVAWVGSWNASVLMDDGEMRLVVYANLSHLPPESHTDVPDDSTSASEAHTEPASTIPQTLGSDPYAGLADCGMDFSQTSGSEQPEAAWWSHSEDTPSNPGVDMVNSPPHYQANPAGIEVIQITEHLNFCLGNAVKYILRCDHKGDAEKDLRKAIWYLERELQRRAAPASVEVSPNEEEQAK